MDNEYIGAICIATAVYVAAVGKDAYMGRESNTLVHAILGPGMVTLMEVTGCPLLSILFVPYVFNLMFDWERR
jgi:hypothetical protein